MHYKLIPNKFFLWGFRKFASILGIVCRLRKPQKSVHKSVPKDRRCTESLRGYRDDSKSFGIQRILRKTQTF